MRALVVSANREKLPDPVVPLGAAYVAAVLTQEGHEVELLDLCFLDDPAGDLERSLDDFCPEVVCLSLRNIDGGASTLPGAAVYSPDYRRWAEIVRKRNRAALVIGGPAVSIAPGEMLEALGADFAIVGEAEGAVPRLVRALAEGDHPEAAGLPGVYRPGASWESQVSGLPRPPDLDRLPVPARHLIDHARYQSAGGCGNVQTKRGCDRACIYCTYPLLEGRTARVRDPRKVVDEVVHLKEVFGVRHVFFVDSLFNHPIEHAEAVCEEIARRRPGVEFSCYANPAFFTERLARLLAEASFVAIEFGTDSGSDPILGNLRKGFRKDDVARVSRLCRAHGLKFCHSLIFGAPGETWESVRETCDFIESLEPTAVIGMVGLSVYPSTDLARMVERANGGRLPDPPHYVAPAVREGLREFVTRHGEEMANWVLPGTTLNMNARVLDLFRKKGITGPLWRMLDLKRSRRHRSLAPGAGAGTVE